MSETTEILAVILAAMFIVPHPCYTPPLNRIVTFPDTTLELSSKHTTR